MICLSVILYTSYSYGMVATQDLHTAVANGDLGAVQALLAVGADINVQNNEGRTPLHNAVISKAYSVIKTLLENGAKKDIRDEDGNTPLYYDLDGIWGTIHAMFEGKDSFNVPSSARE